MNQKLFIGIDDAGRGPVVGPMALAGVLANEEQIEKLKRLGVKDSKMLTPKKRGILFKKIEKIVFAYHIVKTSPSEIDEKISKRINLNKIEALETAKIIEELIKKVNLKTNNQKNNNPEIAVIVDCPSPNTKRWCAYLADHLDDESNKKIELRCEHKADTNYVVVGAASILAKVTRDKAIDEIKKEYNIECGSGYPSDPLCKKFLKTQEARELAKIGLIRKSWATWNNELKKRKQRKLIDF